MHTVRLFHFFHTEDPCLVWYLAILIAHSALFEKWECISRTIHEVRTDAESNSTVDAHSQFLSSKSSTRASLVVSITAFDHSQTPGSD